MLHLNMILKEKLRLNHKLINVQTRRDFLATRQLSYF